MATAPINYLAMFPQQDIGRDITEGLQLGMGIRKMREESQLREQQAQQKEQYSTDLQAAMQGNDPNVFLSLQAKYPQQGEQLRKIFESKDQQVRDSDFNRMRELMWASKKDPEIAVRQADSMIEAARNSGQNTDRLVQIRDGIERDPERASQYIAGFMSMLAPKDYAETMKKFNEDFRAEAKAPAELTEAKAKAASAAVAAKFAESNAAIDLQKKGWDITKIQEDININKQNSRIAAASAQLAREGNDLKRQELGLKVDEMKQKRDEAVRAKSADVESAHGQMDNMLNTADRILATPMNVVGSAAGPVSARMPTVSQDTADFEELINTLGSQSFLAQIPNIKGMGALSNAEGEKLQAALQNLSLRQSPERLMTNVREAQRLILKSRSNVARRYGVPESIPDTPAVAPGASDIDALLQKYGAR